MAGQRANEIGRIEPSGAIVGACRIQELSNRSGRTIVGRWRPVSQRRNGVEVDAASGAGVAALQELMVGNVGNIGDIHHKSLAA